MTHVLRLSSTTPKYVSGRRTAGVEVAPYLGSLQQLHSPAIYDSFRAAAAPTDKAKIALIALLHSSADGVEARESSCREAQYQLVDEGAVQSAESPTAAPLLRQTSTSNTKLSRCAAPKRAHRPRLPFKRVHAATTARPRRCPSSSYAARKEPALPNRAASNSKWNLAIKVHVALAPQQRADRPSARKRESEPHRIAPPASRPKSLSAEMDVAEKSGAARRYRGVYRVGKAPGRWKAQIQVHGKHIYLGRFNDEAAAARAYDAAAIKYFGVRRARLNFEPPSDDDMVSSCNDSDPRATKDRARASRIVRAPKTHAQGRRIEGAAPTERPADRREAKAGQPGGFSARGEAPPHGPLRQHRAAGVAHRPGSPRSVQVPGAREHLQCAQHGGPRPAGRQLPRVALPGRPHPPAQGRLLRVPGRPDAPGRQQGRRRYLLQRGSSSAGIRRGCSESLRHGRDHKLPPAIGEAESGAAQDPAASEDQRDERHGGGGRRGPPLQPEGPELAPSVPGLRHGSLCN
eukprot:scaffold344_cov235-Pinguiococcus_pyrenoidosus.AAC.9